MTGLAAYPGRCSQPIPSSAVARVEDPFQKSVAHSRGNDDMQVLGNRVNHEVICASDFGVVAGEGRILTGGG